MLGTRASLPVILLLVASVAASGCRTIVYFPPSQVERLDGLAPGAPVYIAHPSRRIYPVTTSTPIGFALPEGKTPLLMYQSIRIEDGVFLGTTIGGSEVVFPVSDVRTVAVQYTSVGKAFGIAGITVATVAGVVSSIIALMIIYVVYLYLNR